MQDAEYPMGQAEARRVDRRIELIKVGQMTREVNAWNSGDRGWQARVLVQVGLPHQDPGDVLAWSRANGGVSLLLQPGVKPGPNGQPMSLGLPSGGWPRLALTWLVSEAVNNRSPHVELGRSQRTFLRRLDPDADLSGSGYRRFGTQMDRMLASRWILRDREHPVQVSLQIADQYQLWWDPRQPDQDGLWPSELTIAPGFYERLLQRPVPVDWRAIRALKGSSLALDLYVWLTWRMFGLEAPVLVPWRALGAQLGSDYGRTRDLKRRLMPALADVRCVYPTVNVAATEEGLWLHPSPCHLPRRPGF